ncbi:MAG: amidase [Chloroflexota bacterium]|nr:amidase [Chloroflexota bacterium]
MHTPEIVFESARSLAEQIRTRQRSSREVISAHYDQIERVNPQVNAIVALLDREKALAAADEADKAIAAGEASGPLRGLPIAFKDVENAVGFPNTSGSPIYKDNFPTEDSVIVERIRRAGAIPIGKTNVPEFGLGSHSYNNVYGTTRNPYDLGRTAGGSSGGAAAALATGMLPIADGSDTGGSLRNPANFNNVVGFRISPGLVPQSPKPMPWLPIGVKGPLARTVADCAWWLSVMAGYDPRDQMTWKSEPEQFAGSLESNPAGLRIAWAPDLGGLPVDRHVRHVIDDARPVFESLGCQVEEACPDFTDAEEIFKTIRALNATNLSPLVEKHRDLLKPEAIWNTEEGLKLSAEDVSRAMVKQAALFERTRQFMQDYDAVVAVVNQVPPFPVETTWPREVGGEQMESYIDWMRSAYFVTVTGLPAISVPAGFTPDGLPIGIQIVGRYRRELDLLKLAHAFEQATLFGNRRPPVALLNTEDSNG